MGQSSSKPNPGLSPTTAVINHHDRRSVQLWGQLPREAAVRTLIFGFLNLTSSVAIVMANKVVMYTLGFRFPVALSFVHMVFTVAGIRAMAWAQLFPGKALPPRESFKLAAANTGSIIFNNYSLHWNTVSFYQISKAALTPTILLIETLAYARPVQRQSLWAILVLLLGVVLATVSDPQVTSNPFGVLMAVLNVVVTALCSVWTGAIQRQVGVDGNQLLYGMSPYAAALLAGLVPLVEPLGLNSRAPGTLLGYTLTSPGAFWILTSSMLGLLVTLSAYLFIGATSGTTYSVLGHAKTLLVVGGGTLFFKDSLPFRKVLGLALAMCGILWYTAAQLNNSRSRSQREGPSSPDKALPLQHPKQQQEDKLEETKLTA